MASPRTLYEYYSQKGQKLPSVSDRRSAFGLPSTYVGSSSQNNELLQKLLAGNAGASVGGNNAGNASTPNINAQSRAASKEFNVLDYAPSKTSQDNLLDSLIAENKKLAEGDVDEDKIRREVEDMFQSEIDAINRLYANIEAQRVEQLQPEFNNRTGQGRAIRAASGLLGSARGEAQAAEVDRYNNQIESSVRSEVNAERANRISALLGEARQISTARIAEATEAKRQGADSYIQYTQQQAERQEAQLSTFIQRMIAAGVDVQDLSPEELEEMATSLGVSANQIQGGYLDATRESNLQQEILGYVQEGMRNPVEIAQKLGGRADAAAVAELLESLGQNLSPVELNQGNKLVDPYTGKVIAFNPKTYAPSSSGGGGSSSGYYGIGNSGGSVMSFEEFKQTPEAAQLINTLQNEKRQTFTPQTSDNYLREAYDEMVAGAGTQAQYSDDQSPSLSNLTSSNKRDLELAGLLQASGNTQGYFLSAEASFKQWYSRKVARGEINANATQDTIYQAYQEWEQEKDGGGSGQSLSDLLKAQGLVD